VRDLSSLREGPQSHKPPVRFPFLPLVNLVFTGVGIPVSKALPKPLRVFLCLLDLRVKECGGTLECSDL
jgi:hypothetical protein